MSSSTSSSRPGLDPATLGPRANFRALRPLLGRGLLVGGGFAALWAAWVLLFVGGVRGASGDDVALLRTGGLAALGVALVAGFWLFAAQRSLFRTIVLATLVFFVAGEVYFRLAWFGPEALLEPARYVPASVDHPLCPIPTSRWTPTAFEPSTSSLLKGARFETNSLGFRDRERAVTKPAGTIRIMTIGASQMMGAGVDQDDVFNVVLEDRLNARGDGFRYEVLNFSRGAWQTVDFLHVLEEWGRRYSPDLFVVRGSSGDRETRRQMRHEPATRAEIAASLYAYPFGASFFAQTLRDWIYYSGFVNLRFRLARMSRGLSPFLPPPGEPQAREALRVEEVRLGRKTQLGREAEFLALAAGRDLYAMTIHPAGTRELTIYPGDRHANARAHANWARELETKLEPALARLRAQHGPTPGRGELP